MLTADMDQRLNPSLVGAATPLPTTLAAHLAAAPRHAFAVGESLIATDAKPDHIWFLHDGLVRMYALSAEGHEANLGFHGRGDFVFGRIAWRSGAYCCIDRALGVSALQPTIATRLGVEQLAQWQRDDPSMAAFFIERLLAITSARIGREQDLVQRSAETRYRELLTSQPEITTTVPLQQIASWLGITPVALSRIRKRVHGSDRSVAQ